MELPHGVQRLPLAMHIDDRGVFTEVFRQSWFAEVTPVQWNAVQSRANVLRGVHVHVRHTDYLTVVSGRAVFGLCDLRPASPTAGLRTTIEIDAASMTALVIPPGVAHGFYFCEPSVHVYAVSEYWAVDDELGCHYADPDLALEWPTATPIVSPRDAALPSLGQVMNQLAALAGEGVSTPWPAVSSSRGLSAGAT